MKVLLLGAGGMLARDVAARPPAGVELIARTKAEVDVTDPRAVASALADVQPDTIINCAAYTRVDEAERERHLALAVNGEAPGIIGKAAVSSIPAHRSPLTPLVIHFSTDYVFDGAARRPYREGDPPQPVNAYGASKLAGERALAESGVRYLVVRTSWLFGLHGRAFPRTMWERATAGKPTRVVNDQVGRPTYTGDLASAVWRLVAAGMAEAAGAILHVANAGTATWYDVARRVFEAAGVPELVTPCTSAEYPTLARRPARSVLDTARYERLAGGPLPSWEDALTRFLATLGAEARAR